MCRPGLSPFRENLYAVKPSLTRPSRFNSRRGFVLTIDALLAVGLLVSAFFAIATFTHLHQFTDPSPLQRLGRDYLRLNYAQNAPLSPAAFTRLTGYALSESAPNATASLTVRADLRTAGEPCACPVYPCSLTSAQADACTTTIESATLTDHVAWVNP